MALNRKTMNDKLVKIWKESVPYLRYEGGNEVNIGKKHVRISFQAQN
jgi:hypothetical protein